MPLIVAAVVVLAVLALAVLLLPISLIQRYRLGTRRRLARGWVTALNLSGVAISVALFMFSAALMTPWLPGAFTSALAGLLAGFLVGGVGLLLTRWEATAGGVYYTPHWLPVLMLTLLIAARLIYGLRRGWAAWETAPNAAAWLSHAGANGSLAVGAVVLGYYLVYWFGVRRRMRRHPPVRRL